MTVLFDTSVIVPALVDQLSNHEAAVSSRGAGSGIIYDALHSQAALKAGCDRLYTYNLANIRLITPDSIKVTAP